MASLRVLLGATGALALAVATAAAPASAARRHLRLLRAFPAADTALATSPAAIRLWLSEPAEMPTTRIELSADGGAAIALAPLTRATAKDAPVEGTLQAPLPTGRYVVAWRTMSKDGHVVKGTFRFRVGTAR